MSHPLPSLPVIPSFLKVQRIHPMKQTLKFQLFIATAAAFSFNSAFAVTINKANNTTPLSETGSWTGGVVPQSGDIAAFSSGNTVSSTPVTIGTGVGFLGIAYSDNPATNLTINAGTAGTLTLGASGIDLSAGSRTLTIGSTVSLGADQTWTTGTAAANTSQLVANAVISGSGKLTINGTTGSPHSPVYFNAANTFTGGVAINSGASVRLGSAAPAFALDLPTASVLGTGNLAISGGTIFGGGGAAIAPSTITVTGDFGLNVGISSLNGRFTLAGGTMNLGGNRTVSLGRYDTTDAVGGVMQGGLESLRLAQTTGAPLISIQNGTLRLVRESLSSPTAADYVSVTFGVGSSFAAGAGLAIGDHVITTMATGNPFGTTAGAQPILTVESGGYFNMSDAANARSPFIRSLAGAGTVTSFSSTGAQTSTLTVNPQNGDLANFSGSIADGSTLTAVVSGAASPVKLTKSGAGTQVLSGVNNYSGATTVSSGILQFAKKSALYNNTPASWTATNLVVDSGATLAFNVGGGDEFIAADVASLASLGTASGGFKSGSKLGLDTTNAGGSFTYNSVLANPNGGANGLGLRKLGTGTLVLNQVNTYTGGTTVEGGAITIFGNAGLGTGSLVLNAGTVLNADFSGLVVPENFTHSITGTGTINATPASGAANAFGFTSGTLTTFAGTINVKPSPASNTRVNFNGLIGPGATVNVESGATGRFGLTGTYAGITVNAVGQGGDAGSAIRLDAGGVFDNACAVNLLGTTSIGGFTGNGTIECAIADGGNGYSLIKAGSSILILTAPNTYSGDTNVTGGTLRISKPYLANGSAVTIASTGAVLDLNFDESGGAVTDTVATLTIGTTQKAAGTYGATGSGADNIDDDHFAGIGTLTVTTGPSSGSNYASWAIDQGIPGQPSSGDYDNDGLTNLTEYALGKDPKVSSVPPGTFSAGVVSYTKGAAAIANGDVSWVIEQSSTLTSWAPVVTQNAGDPALTIAHTLPSGQPKIFARLKVTQLP